MAPGIGSSNWVAVASAEHVAIGRAGGFMQVGHGKGAPLKRLHGGDRIAYYSPMRRLGGKEACQAFTAIGTVRDERIYQGRMADGFEPFRRDVDWCDAHEAPIRALLDALSFTQGKSNWGVAFRFGLLKVTANTQFSAVHVRESGSASQPHSRVGPVSGPPQGSSGVRTGVPPSVVGAGTSMVISAWLSS